MRSLQTACIADTQQVELPRSSRHQVVGTEACHSWTVVACHVCPMCGALTAYWALILSTPAQLDS